MAGRNISVEREAIGPVRVMRTCGMMGEIVGKAAWICVRHKTSPRGVYTDHLPLLKELMQQPGAMRRATLDGTLALPPGVSLPTDTGFGLDPATLEGIVIDDANAVFSGNWEDATSLRGFVSNGYRYSSDATATASFPFRVETAGLYEVRIAWQPHKNRAKSATVIVRSADGEKLVLLNQTQAANGKDGFESLGRFRFAANTESAVLFKVAGSNGTVHVDAVQVVPAR
jgi:hypothetical protein